MVAVPIRYQTRAIGVLTVSARETNRFSRADVAALEEIAQRSAKFLRRVELDQELRARTGRPFLIKGLSPEWLEVERRLEQAAPTNAPVLIRGESGTGKDLVANAIHFNSLRSKKPLVTVNCAAIPETLLESILFGHVKGAFTGASFNKTGEFQKADQGSLFLDEVGELPLMLQGKVLRAVEQGEVQPLGSNKAPERVDVRLICATNRDLEGMARRGEFREDLYYRLSVMMLELPPLRSYKDNLEVLAHVFLEQASERHQKTSPSFSPAALATLLAYDYPGNIRELKNAVEHAVIMCAGDVIDVGDLPRALHQPMSPRARKSKARTLKQMRDVWLDPLERRYLTELLTECRGNVRKAAAQAGINPVTLYRLLKKRGIAISRQVDIDTEN
jgi:two-component system response regulator HydG